VRLEIVERLRHHQAMWMRVRAARPASQFAELYAGALDRLGDPQPHQRMGALYTFESLGDAYPRHVQAVVDVICAYVRSHDEPERGIQHSAWRLLVDHLRPGGRRWADVDVDLVGAGLPDLDLSDCRMRGLRLDGAVVHGPARLQRITVSGSLSLRRVQFCGDVWLEHASVSGPARFDGAAFHGDAWLGGMRFRDAASFRGACFDGHAWFNRCEFDGPLDFAEALFRRSAGFRGAVARGEIGLAGTTFLGPARVSRLGEGWNVAAPGWGVVVDPDNESIGHLLWLGAGIRAPS
jgi:pentapeptide repeat protein